MSLPTKPRRRFPFEGWAIELESEGMRSAIIAAAVFGVVEVFGAALTELGALWPIKSAASLLIRERAYEPGNLAFVIPLGVAVHFCLAVAYGYAFGLLSTESRLSIRTNTAREAFRGVLFGALLWVLNFQFFARNLYPWIFSTEPLLQLAAHALSFGAVLAVLFTRRERLRVKKSGPP